MDTMDSEVHLRPDVVVCGAGLAGLTAAATAATGGAKVLVLDPNPPGGRARTTESDGFLLNAGPHALYADGHARRVLGELGVRVQGAAVPIAGSDAAVDGSVTTLPVWPSGLLRSRALRLRDKPRFAALMTRATKVDPASVSHLSVRDWCERERLSAEARRVVEAIARLSTYASAPHLQSADALFTQLGLGGVMYLDGGWQSIVDGLTEAARSSGAQLAAVKPISVQTSTGGPGWEVRLADGRLLNASAVVLACGSPRAMTNLAELPGSWMGRSGPPVRAACLDLGIRGEPARRFVLGIDEPMYLSRHDPPARLSPEGHSLVSVAEYLGVESAPDSTGGREPAAGRARLEDWANRCGVVGSQVVKTRYLHDMVVAHGMPTAAGGGLSGRPSVEVLGVEGLFAAGDWIGPEGLLADAAVASGSAAGRLAAGTARSLPVDRRAAEL